MTGPRIAVGTIWQRVNGRERVRVGRVWLWPGEGWTVRAHPLTGGRYLVAAQDWFLENYAPLTTTGASPDPKEGAG